MNFKNPENGFKEYKEILVYLLFELDLGWDSIYEEIEDKITFRMRSMGENLPRIKFTDNGVFLTDSEKGVGVIFFPYQVIENIQLQETRG